MGKKRGFLIATSAGFAAAAAMPGAQAADMPIKAPRYVEPAADWSGWYIGANAGAAWQKTDVTTDSGIFSHNGYKFDPNPNASLSKTGFIGGGQIGYNWQRGNFVFGLEGDISGLDGKASASLKNGFKGGYEVNYSSRIQWLSTVRTRFGLAVGDTMAYMTAGVAFGGVKNSVFSEKEFGTTYSSSKTKTGWTVGGGVEHMLSRNWTIGLEGLFVDLGHSTVHVDNEGDFQFANQAIIGRMKLNYKF
jgi:outer membrane immunogenic protein